jgi:hypothetical protein
MEITLRISYSCARDDLLVDETEDDDDDDQEERERRIVKNKANSINNSGVILFLRLFLCHHAPLAAMIVGESSNRFR